MPAYDPLTELTSLRARIAELETEVRRMDELNDARFARIAELEADVTEKRDMNRRLIEEAADLRDELARLKAPVGMEPGKCEQDLFEEWAKPRAAHCLTNGDGEYLDPIVRGMFNAWLARSKLSAAQLAAVQAINTDLANEVTRLEMQLADRDKRFSEREPTALRSRLRECEAERDAALAREAKYRAALGKAAKTFAKYAAIHGAKTPPDLEKATANLDLAQECSEALSTPHSALRKLIGDVEAERDAYREQALAAETDAVKLFKALNDLSFDCCGGIGVQRPSVSTYNATFAVIEELRERYAALKETT